ncbi:MAG: ABC transporter substrate-binding protein [Alphaproteobacteria bacterium]|nr:MAG: ABC transporter substrate-binding protein [Alphaproteobacteria bacterium]
MGAFAAGVAALALMASAADAKTFRWSVAGDANTMDPHSQNAGPTTLVLRQIYEPLVARGKNAEVTPRLATEWRQVDPTTWRFTLRRGVSFHNGNPFNADDVVFSIRRSLAPTSQYSIFTDTIQEARKVDDLTVDIVTKVPDPVLIDKLTSLFMMDEEWSKQNNVELPQDFRNRQETFAVRNTNGTGPFFLHERVVDQRTVLRRFANYHSQIESNITEAIFRPITADATRVSALRSGDLDFILDPPVQTVEQLKRESGLRVLEGPENRNIFIGMDQGSPELQYSNIKGRNPFQDVRVRRAVSLAIDVEAIRARTMRGLAVPSASFIPVGTRGWIEEIARKPRPVNREQARQLLTEAGYAQGFEVTMDCSNNRYINDDEICQAVAAMLAQIGIRVQLNIQPFAQFLPKIQRNDTSMFLLGWGVPTFDALYSFQSLVHTRTTGSFGLWNHARISNPQMDALIQQMIVELDPAKRNQVIGQALRLFDEQVMYVMLHEQVIPWAMRANVTAVHTINNQLELQWTVVN